jgi:hypothetical protein
MLANSNVKRLVAAELYVHEQAINLLNQADIEIVII